jgi:hypothetical protein
MMARCGFAFWLGLIFLPVAVSAQSSEPVWPKPDRFWYRTSVPGGNIWVIVDLRHGLREPLFDHHRLAAELTLTTGIEFTILTLPFADPSTRLEVKYDGPATYTSEGDMALEFDLSGEHWRCDLQVEWDWTKVPPSDYLCASQGSVEIFALMDRGPDTGPRVSPDGTWEAFVQAGNVVIRPAGGGAAGVRVLSSDGSAADGYQLGSIEWSSDSKAITAYRVASRVWMSDGFTGKVGDSITRGTWTVPPANE